MRSILGSCKQLGPIDNIINTYVCIAHVPLFALTMSWSIPGVAPSGIDKVDNTIAFRIVRLEINSYIKAYNKTETQPHPLHGSCGANNTQRRASVETVQGGFRGGNNYPWW